MLRDERHLLILMHRGDEAAARLLWERHAPILRRYAASILHGDEHLANDVACEVLAHVLTLRRSQVKAVQDVAAWLIASCRRRSVTLIRASRRRRNREAMFSRRFGQAPDATDRTDLASVPAIFWSLIASYGRQTAPAVVHDSECLRVQEAQRDGRYTPTQALDDRECVDRAFRIGLRELGVAPFRAWIMWTFVSFERYLKHSVPRFVGLLLLVLLGLGLVAGSPVALVLGAPWWGGALMLVAPLATSALAGARWQLLVWASYASALLLPVAMFQVLAYLPYAAIENVVWFFVDWLPHRKGSPVVGPVDVKNMRRT